MITMRTVLIHLVLTIIFLPTFLVSVYAEGQVVGEQKMTPLHEIGTIHVGYVPVFAGAPIFIALDKGYFAEQGLDVELHSFRSGALMAAPLSTGQLDAGFGQVGPEFFNAVNQGMDIRAVATGFSQPPGFGSVPLLVRRDLFESGEVTGVNNLKGRKVAINLERSIAEYLLAEALAQANLSVNDVQIVTLPFPEMVAAFANNAIDAAILPHPLAAMAIHQKTAAVLMKGDQVSDNSQVAIISFGHRLLQPEYFEMGVRFMMAYLKGISDISGDNWQQGENVAIISKYTNVPAPVVQNSVPPFFELDGSIHAESLEKSQQYYFERGYTELTAPLPVDHLINHAFREEALSRLKEVQ